MAELDIQSLESLTDLKQNKNSQTESYSDRSDIQKENTPVYSPLKTRSQSKTKDDPKQSTERDEGKEKSDAESKEEAYAKKQMRGRELAEMMKERRRSGSVKHRRTKQQRAELSLPVSDILKKLKIRFPEFRVLTEAGVYLAGVLENIVLKILESSGHSAKNEERYLVKPNDITYALVNDDELYEVFKDIYEKLKKNLKAEEEAAKKKLAEAGQQAEPTAETSKDQIEIDISEDEEYNPSQETIPDTTDDDESRVSATDVSRDKQLDREDALKSKEQKNEAQVKTKAKGGGRGRGRGKGRGRGRSRSRSRSSKQSKGQGKKATESKNQDESKDRGQKRSGSTSEYASESEADTDKAESVQYTPKRRRKSNVLKKIVDIDISKDDNVLVTQHGFFLKLTSLDQLNNVLSSPYVQKLLEITKSIEHGESSEKQKSSRNNSLPGKSNILKENQNITNISTGMETPISDTDTIQI